MRRALTILAATLAFAAPAHGRALVEARAPAPASPAHGRVLVEAPGFGLAIVAPDGGVERLGEYYGAAWSPDGGRIAAARGRALVVLDARGGVAWTRRTAGEPVQPDWSGDGRLLAYRRGSELRVIGAGGRRDRTVARGLRFAGPRWRPGAPGQLAYAGARGIVRLRDLDSGPRWVSRPGPPVRPAGLQWSADGARLAVISGSAVRIFDGRTGALLRRLTATRRGHFQFGTYAGTTLVLARHDFTRGISRVTTPGRTLFAGRGRVTELVPSPDGRSVLIGRRGGDEWRFQPLAGAPEIVRGVTRMVNPDAPGLWAFPAARGWRAP